LLTLPQKSKKKEIFMNKQTIQEYGDETKIATQNLEAENQDQKQEEKTLANWLDLEGMLNASVLRAIQEMGFASMTPIQEKAIPYLLQGRDIIGQAQTGTGKTAAFGIPMIQKVDPQLKTLQAIVLCPTRELAIQAAEEIRRLSRFTSGVKVLPVYGGQDITKQIVGLKGTQIIVGTPGRVMDHMRRHTIKLDDVSMVVLDEADEMLNMGFLEDMELILGEITQDHQTALFSATMPKPILNITGKFQKDATLIKVTSEELTIPLVSQRYYRIKNKDKDAACIRLLEYYQPKLCLIFCNTKMKVDDLSEALKKAGFHAEALHGDMSQHMRDAAMKRFRNGVTNILIATDVAARGIDVYDVEAVINYDIPQDIEYYVHRIGRTGRAGRTGRSFTFVSGREIYRVRDIERFCRTTIEEKKVPAAGKVMKAKAQKILDQVYELKDHPDVELMKKYLETKMEQEDIDALDLAALLLKHYVGDAGEEIEADDFEIRRSRGDGGRGGRSFGGRGGSYGGQDRGRYADRGRFWDRERSRYTDREGSADRPKYSRDGAADRPRYNRDGATDRPRYNRDGATDRPRYNRDGASDRPRYNRDGDTDRPRYNRDGDTDRPRYNRDSAADRPRYSRDGETDRPRYHETGDRPRYADRDGSGDRPRYADRDGGADRPRYADRDGNGDRSRYADREKRSGIPFLPKKKKD
jgi:ATP-dependent RNA helicase DeaD